MRANTRTVHDIKLIKPVVDVTLVKDAEGDTYFENGEEVIMIRTLQTQGISS